MHGNSITNVMISGNDNTSHVIDSTHVWSVMGTTIKSLKSNQKCVGNLM